MELKSHYSTRLNMLPTQFRVKRSPNWVRLIFTILLIGLSFFVGFSFVILNFRIELVTSSIEQLQQDVAVLREQERRMQELQREINQIEQRVNTLQDLVLSEPEWLPMIQAIGESMPGDLLLKEASFTGNRITFSGDSVSIFSLAQFIENLSGHRNSFQSAIFQSLSYRDGLYAFNLTLEIQP